jgi:hypothetical protein
MIPRMAWRCPDLILPGLFGHDQIAATSPRNMARETLSPPTTPRPIGWRTRHGSRGRAGDGHRQKGVRRAPGVTPSRHRATKPSRHKEEARPRAQPSLQVEAIRALGGHGDACARVMASLMMWDDRVFPKVTGCRTPGGDAPRRLALISAMSCSLSCSRSREPRVQVCGRRASQRLRRSPCRPAEDRPNATRPVASRSILLVRLLGALFWATRLASMVRCRR